MSAGGAETPPFAGAGALGPARPAALEARLLEIMRVMPNGIALFDHDDRLALWNPQFAAMIPDIACHVRAGATYERITMAIAEADILDPDQGLSAAEWTDARLAAHRNRPGSQLVRLRDGRFLQMNEHRTALGETVALWTDVSEAKTSERDLREAKDAAEQASRAKTRFLAAASHDLRQPVTAVALWIEVLLNTIRDAEAVSVLERLRDSVVSLSAALATMLELSQLEAGLTVPRIETVRLRPVMESLQIEFEKQAEARGLRLKCVLSDLVVETDPQLLRRILSNLLTNAIRYTDRGRILLGCRRRGARARIEVWDTGIGIPASELETIFEEFTQLAHSRDSESPSLGLGLSIVRRLAELLDHQVFVRSAVDKGSVFGVELLAPPARPEPAVLPATNRADVSLLGKLGLIVDDDEAVLASMAALLRAWGCRTMTATSAGAAVTQLADDIPPDFVISDYRIKSDLSGIDTIRWIRAHAKREIPAIILTADTGPETVRQITASGNRLLLKPVRAGELKSTILELLRSAAR